MSTVATISIVNRHTSKFYCVYSIWTKKAVSLNIATFIRYYSAAAALLTCVKK